jgi:hypothetical protein
VEGNIVVYWFAICEARYVFRSRTMGEVIRDRPEGSLGALKDEAHMFALEFRGVVLGLPHGT